MDPVFTAASAGSPLLPVPAETEWFRDGEIDLLLRHTLSSHTDQVEFLTAMLGTDWRDSNDLTENLNSFNLNRAAALSRGESVKNKVLIPVNLGGNHWVLVCLHYQATHVDIFYIDPFGNELEPDLKVALNSVFPATAIIDSSLKLQMDDYNCGPWVIEIAQTFLNHDRIPKPEEVDISARRLAQRAVLAAIRAANPDEYRAALGPPDLPIASAAMGAPPVSSAAPSTLIAATSPIVLSPEENARALALKKINAQCTVDDMHILETLKETSLKLIDQEALTDENSLSYVKALTNAFRALSRNKDDASRIRNQFGKINYNKGGGNARHIDFEAFGLFPTIGDSLMLKLSEAFKNNWKEFKSELKLLISNIDVILTEQFKDGEVMALCTEEFKAKLPKVEKRKSVQNFSKLSALFEIYTDAFYLERLADPKLLADLMALYAEKDPLQQRYSLGRILVILGELSKNLSPYFKSQYAYLPLSMLKNIRNLMSHAHYRAIASDKSGLHLELGNLIVNFANCQAELGAISDEMARYMSDKDFAAAGIYEKIKIRLEMLGSRLPKRLRVLYAVEPPETLSLPEDLAAPDRRLLISLRVQFLENFITKRPFKMKDLGEELEFIERVEVSGAGAGGVAPASVSVGSREILKCRATIAHLVALEALNPKQKEGLDKAKKRLLKLEESTEAPKLVGKSSETLRVEIEELKLKISAAKAELLELRWFPFFDDLESQLKPKAPVDKAKAPVDASMKRHWILKDILAELSLLKLWLNKEVPEGRRDYAREQCFAAIGQYFRDLNDLNDKEIREIQQQNQLLREGGEKGVTGRNVTTHDPIVDYSELLRSITNFNLMPIFKDIQALKTITANDIQRVQQSLIGEVSTYYNNRGMAYSRLNFKRQARDCFEKALESSTDEAIFNDMGLSPGTVLIILDQDNVLAAMRISITNNLAACLLQDKEFDKAYKLLIKIFNDYSKTPPQQRPKIPPNFFIQLVNAIFQRDTVLKKDKDIYENIKRHLLGSGRYDDYANVIFNVAIMCHYEKNNFEEALRLMKGVDLSKISDKRILQQFYSNIALIRSELFVINKSMSPAPMLSEARSILSEAEKSLSLIKLNYLELKAEYGDSVRLVLEKITENLNKIAEMLSKILGSKAAELLNTKLEESLVLIDEALLVQNRYSIYPGASLYTKANIYLGLFTRSSLPRDRRRYFQSCVDTLDSMLSDKAPRNLARVASLRAYLYRLNKDSEKAMFFYIESAFFHRMFDDKDTDETADYADLRESLLFIGRDKRELLRTYALKLLLELKELSAKTPGAKVGEAKELEVALHTCQLRHQIVVEYLKATAPTSSSVSVVAAAAGAGVFSGSSKENIAPKPKKKEEKEASGKTAPPKPGAS